MDDRPWWISERPGASTARECFRGSQNPVERWASDQASLEPGGEDHEQPLTGRSPSGTQFPNMTFVMADVDRMPEMAHDIRYTPTFSFYVNGKKVDEIFGSNRRQIGDRMWLHAD